MKMSELYAIGERVEIGSHTFTPENIIHFASRFDPQVFHIDAEAAKQSLFGGLCASGWHSCSMWMRSFVDYWKSETARLIAADMKRHGGLMALGDLQAYRAKERVPLRGSYRGYPIISMPPPSSGGAGSPAATSTVSNRGSTPPR